MKKYNWLFLSLILLLSSCVNSLTPEELADDGNSQSAPISDNDNPNNDNPNNDNPNNDNPNNDNPNNDTFQNLVDTWDSSLASNQLLNLPPAPATGRFTVKDRQWSSTYGQIHISQWYQDKIAAISVTIDDNTLPDHQWWLKVAEEFKIPLTWFIITGPIGGGGAEFYGTWQTWKDILAKGHDVQSHTVSHLKDSTLNLTQEYNDSQQSITQYLQQARPLTLSYPNGLSGNDPELAKRNYIAGRSTIGILENPAKIDFMRVHKISEFLNFFSTNQNHKHNSFVGVLDPNNTTKGRTWYCTLFHSLNNAHKSQIRRVFQYIDQNRGDIWAAKFLDAAQYAQEFASAKISVREVLEDSIRFQLHDTMKDSYFDHPLTVKITLNNSWQNFSVTQNGQNISYEIIEHSGDRFVLLQATPDRGEVRLIKQ